MTSEEIRTEIAAVSPDLAVAWVNTHAARLAVQQLEGQARVALLSFRGGEDLATPANNVGTALSFARSDSGRDLAAARIVRDLLEASPEFKEASAILDPLHESLVAAEAQERKELHRLLQAEAALADAEQAARLKLEAKIKDDPSVTKARAALSGIKRLGKTMADLEDPALELAQDFH